MAAPTPPPPAIKPLVYTAVMVSALSGVLFGYDIGATGGTFAMPGFLQFFGWPPSSPSSSPSGAEGGGIAQQEGWIVSIFALGCMLGSLPSGFLADHLGRKRAMVCLALLFTAGAAVQLSTLSMAMLYTGRAICGFASGGLSMVAPLYQSEIAPARARGVVVTMQTVAITGGILLSSLLNIGLQHWEMGWRLSYGGSILFSTLLFISMSFMPESPRWLLSQGLEEEAIEVLHRVRCPQEVKDELAIICSSSSSSSSSTSPSTSDPAQALLDWRQAARYLLSYRTAMAIAVSILSQLSGINGIVYFAPEIFAKNGATASDALTASLIVTTINFLGVFIALFMVDRAGRRLLLVFGGLSMSVCMALCALLTTSIPSGWAGRDRAMVALISLYAGSFAASWDGAGWMVPAEMFPQQVRGLGMSMTTLLNWGTNFLVVKMTPQLMLPSYLGLPGTFAFYAGTCAVMTAFTLLLLPETKGVDLEHMDHTVQAFRHLPWVKRLQLKPHPPTSSPSSLFGEVGLTAAGMTSLLEEGKEEGLQGRGTVRSSWS